jgi:tight adherence protein B
MSPTLLVFYALGFLILLGGIVFIVVMARVLSTSDDISDRVLAYSVITDQEIERGQGRQRVRLLRLRLRLNNALSFFVPKGLRLQLISAHWPIYETEFVLIRLGISALGLLSGWFFSQSILPGIGLAVLAYLIPGILLRRSINQRRQRFGRQLIDVLVLVNGGVSAGYSLLQSLDIVVDEMQSPASEEFYRVRREVELGLTLNQALRNLAERMENDDLDIVVAAININMQVGGNLTVMLNSVIQTIRERIRLFSEVRALTSSQRYTGYVLTSLPFILGSVLFILNPTYMAKMFEPGMILCVPIGALLGILMGNLIISQLVKIDV